MKQLKQYWQANTRTIGWFVFATLGLALLMFYRLGSLTHGLSATEAHTATNAVGWHGIYRAPLDLPLKAIRSIVFYLSPGHGQTLTRLPNTFFGALAIIGFGWLTWLWHGRRTTLLVTPLFATSAWVLHVSRYANFDVIYLWAIVSLLLAHALVQRYAARAVAWYSVLFFWGIFITIPGMIWFLLPELYLQRSLIRKSWGTFQRWWQRCLSIVVPLIWLPLIVIDLTRPGQLITWLGAPNHFAHPTTLLKQFIGVFIHLLVRGPEHPALWLGRLPVLDAFTLAMTALGIYFYGTHWRTSRSRLLEVLFAIGVILVTIQGPVSLSVLVPLAYATAAMGIAYLVHEWLQVFPLNPLARSLGIGLVVLTVAVSCIYNVRAYFIAWPHSPVTQTIFRYHR